MKEAGMSLVAVAILAMIGGLLIDVSVRTSSFQEVTNLHKMHVQALVLQGAFSAFVAGVVLIAGGAIVERLDSLSRPDAAAPVDAVVADSSAGRTAEEARAGAPSDEWMAPAIAVVVLCMAALAIAVVTVPDDKAGVPTDLNGLDTGVFNVDGDLDNAAAAQEAAEDALNAVARAR